MMKAKQVSQPMPYTLITSQGRIMQFYIKETAELYRNLKGGVVVTNEILNQELVDTLND